MPLPAPTNVPVSEVLITEPTAENINKRLIDIGVAVIPLSDITDKQRKDVSQSNILLLQCKCCV